MADDEKAGDGARKRELIARLERARGTMRRDLGHVRYRSDVGSRAKESVKRHAGGWLAGATLTGLLAGYRLMRPAPRIKKVYIDANTGKPAQEAKQAKQGFWMGIISVVFNLIQPAIVAMVQKHLLKLAGQEQEKHVDEAVQKARA